ncbi:hypothetical protein SRABI106_03721 [Rahnella aquatilis]|nr:hypothetical protein SRABI106_03721 [Rahnella aquatilis]
MQAVDFTEQIEFITVFIINFGSASSAGHHQCGNYQRKRA